MVALTKSLTSLEPNVLLKKLNIVSKGWEDGLSIHIFVRNAPFRSSSTKLRRKPLEETSKTKTKHFAENEFLGLSVLSKRTYGC